MGADTDNSLPAEYELHRHAEEMLSAHEAELHPPRTEDATKRLVHELEVNKIELKMHKE